MKTVLHRYPLMEQFLQLGAQIQELLEKSASKANLSPNEVRMLMWLGVPDDSGTVEPRVSAALSPSELAKLSGLPKNRIAESLTSLTRRLYIKRVGSASADQRTRAFQLTPKGQDAVQSLSYGLAPVEGVLEYAMRTGGRRAGKIMLAAKYLSEIPPRE